MAKGTDQTAIKSPPHSAVKSKKGSKDIGLSRCPLNEEGSCSYGSCRNKRGKGFCIKQHYEENKELMLAKDRGYYHKNKQGVLARQAKHRKQKNVKQNIKLYAKAYYKKHIEEFRAYRERNKVARAKYQQQYFHTYRRRINKEYACTYIMKRYRTEPGFRLNMNISKAIRKALHGNKNGRHWEHLVGYTLKDLKEHLEQQFDENMSWENYPSYWHIDHIYPLSCYIYEKAEDRQFRLAWSLQNLQPLEKFKNLSKGNRLVLNQ